jgi:hypothetical protein
MARARSRFVVVMSGASAWACLRVGQFAKPDADSTSRFSRARCRQATPAPAATGRDAAEERAEPHVVRRRRWALHTNWTARPLFCAATNALLSANGRKVSAFTGSDLPEPRFGPVSA